MLGHGSQLAVFRAWCSMRKKRRCEDANILFSDVELPTATGFRHTRHVGRTRPLLSSRVGRPELFRTGRGLSERSGTWLLGRSVFHKPSGSTQTAMSSKLNLLLGTCGPDRARPAPPRRRGKGILVGREHGSHLDRQRQRLADEWRSRRFATASHSPWAASRGGCRRSRSCTRSTTPSMTRRQAEDQGADRARDPGWMGVEWNRRQ